MIRTLLIANRGEIACRILSTCARLGIRSVVVYSESDANSLAVCLADEAVPIGPSPAASSYLNIDAILHAAALSNADAVHPGYGFLAESSDFAKAVIGAGLTFVGPRPEVIAELGSKVSARELCARVGVPLLPGSSALDDDGLLDWAQAHGYPVMLKASAGGGGKGMRRLQDRASLHSVLASARREAQKAFGSSELYLEKALVAPRHLEVQVASDHFGNHVHLGVRECSLQRRHQKIIEECPPTNVSSQVIDGLTSAALKLAKEVGYTNVGTVEFLVSGEEFYFLEVNTRLQVEHPVTEAVTGIDLVELQLAIAEDRRLPMTQNEVVFRGHAIEARVACEDPSNAFLPSTGPVLAWSPPPSLRARVDAGIQTGGVIGPHYDSLAAKVVCWGDDRAAALRRLEWSLRNTVLLGVRHNMDFLTQLLRQPTVVQGRQNTEFVETLTPSDTVVTRRHLLAAAAARCQLLTTSQGCGLGSFPLELAFKDQPTVAFSAGKFSAEGQSYRVEFWQGTLIVDGHRGPASVARYGDLWWVHTPEGTVCLTALPRHPLPFGLAPSGSLKAPMPGSIVEVLVQLGDQVEASQPLMKLEAMKMEHVICAPTAGVVQALPFSVGDQVEVGVELVTLTEQDRLSPKDV